ncbi:hypothetical protein DID73_01260 [Candidatus Marinamargulisbacteria bacterium SCGC AG-343-K17]|nr:hypothetical protein DID73_01260 [Candidatus Marinamargulisbacteria bacterium SCGC AG-343-K17]
MNWQSFITLIQEQSENTFFLSNTRQERLIGQTLSALLNTLGGKLIVGYDKVNVHLTGYEQTDQWIDQFLADHFKNTSITSTFLFRSNKKILILDIEKSEREMPYSGKYYKIHEKKITEYTPINSQPMPPIQPAPTPEITEQAPITQPLPATTTAIENNTDHSPYQPPSQETEKPVISSTFDAVPQESLEHSDKLNTRQKKAIDFITKQGSIKNKQYRKLFGVSHKTAHIELAELVQQEKVMIVGSGRSTCYRLPNPNQKVQKMETISQVDSVIPKSLLESFMAKHQNITESMYADEFNMDMAQAINELQHFCEEGILEKTLINNETCYTKATQLSFI